MTETTHSFINLGIEVTEIRSLDRMTGLIVREAFGPDGSSVDLDSLRLTEQRLRIAARGKISPELGEILSAVDAADIVPVVFWLAVHDEPDFRGIIDAAVASGVDPEDARRLALDEGRRFFSPETNAFARLLEARGFAVEYTGTSWPIVIASIPAEQVGILAALDRIDQAYYCYPEHENENNYAQPTLRSPTVHRRGYDGACSVKVMIQDSSGHPTVQNPYLPRVIKLNSGRDDWHATAVAGNVCMQNHSLYYGVAPALERIYSAEGWGDQVVPDVWDMAMQAGVSFGNCSWWNQSKGSIVFLDRFFDYTIRNYAVMMFKSAGNQGETSEPYVTSPGNGYNMITTGCYNDGDSYQWEDDSMALYSSYWNPIEGHEKPEVAAPGDKIATTLWVEPWIEPAFWGTSSASPLTMGTALLMAHRDPSIIVRPQLVKAALMVSAWHNVEGGPAVLSDRDGAGGVHTAAADALIRDGQYETGTFLSTSFPYDTTIHCYKGDGTRIICLWHSDPDSAYTTDLLKMDLDMTVIDPNGDEVAVSASVYNPFELVYFEPPVTGNYIVRMTMQTFLGSSEPYCIAWSSRQDMACAEISMTGSPQVGSGLDFLFYDQYEYDERFATLLSLNTLPDLIDLEGGYILPVAWDALARACFNGVLPGFTGYLDGAGEARTSLKIPYNPSLVGVTVHCTMVVVGKGGVPRDTAEAVSFTITM